MKREEKLTTEGIANDSKIDATMSAPQWSLSSGLRVQTNGCCDQVCLMFSERSSNLAACCATVSDSVS